MINRTYVAGADLQSGVYARAVISDEPILTRSPSEGIGGGVELEIIDQAVDLNEGPAACGVCLALGANRKMHTCADEGIVVTDQYVITGSAFQVVHTGPES